MKLANSTITRIVNEANNQISISGLDIKLKKAYEDSERCNIHMVGYGKMYVIIISKKSEIVTVDEILPNRQIVVAHFIPKKSTELLAFITLVMAKYIALGKTINVKVLQSTSSWGTNTKRLLAEDWTSCDMHTETLKVAIHFGFISLDNAKIAKNGNIIIDRKRTPSIHLVMSPDYRWKTDDYLIKQIMEFGY